MGAVEFLAFLRHLPQVVQVDRLEVEPNAGEGLVLQIRGSLKESHRPVFLRTFYGATTELRRTRKAEHWALLADALAHDQIVVYTGHAALGATLSADMMSDKLGIQPEKLARKIARPGYQLLGFFNCYSYSYFGEDIARLRSEFRGATERPGRRITDFVLSGTKDAGSKYALSLLKMVDRSFSGGQVSIEGGLDLYLWEDDYLVFKRFVHG
jgi:hypothetical protein